MRCGMKLIDADMLLENYEQIKQLLIQKYGEKEALNGLHFSLNDCINNIQNQPEVKPEIKPEIKASKRTVETIDILYKITDALRIRNMIYDCHSCEDCGISYLCEHRPEPGEMQRYNCPLWEIDE